MDVTMAAAAAIKSLSSIPTNNLNLSIPKPTPYPFPRSTSYTPITKFLHTPSPDPSKNPKPNSTPFKSFPSYALAASSPPTPPITPLPETKLAHLKAEFSSLKNPKDRINKLLHYATQLPPFPEASKTDTNRVMGCTSQVWLEVRLEEGGEVRFKAESDSSVTRGLCACLVWVLDGAKAEEVLRVRNEDLVGLNVGGVEGKGASSRANTWHNVLVSMQKRVKGLVAEREGRARFEPFPSMVISADGIQAKGAYAESQVG